MKRTFPVILMLLIVPLAPAAEEKETEGQDVEGTLLDLLPVDEALPEELQFKEVPKGEKLPFGMTSNPYQSTDEKFVEAFSGGVFSKKVEKGAIASALFAVYEEATEAGAEVGFFAFEFDTDKNATAAMATLPKASERSVHLQRGPVVLWVWCDKGTPPECFKMMVKHLEGESDDADCLGVSGGAAMVR